MADRDERSLAELRRRVAACTRLLHREGILGYSGHVSARAPMSEGADRFLIQSFGDSRADLDPDRLILCDLECRPVPGSGSGRLPNETVIHAEVYRRRPDVRAVVHMHPEMATLFTLVEGASLLPVKMHAVRWADGIPTHPEPGHIRTPEEGRALAETLGAGYGVLLRAHGAVLVAEDVPALLADAIHFEENARAQVLASALGPVAALTPAEIEALRAKSNRAQHAAKLWDYYLGLGVEAGGIPAEWAG